MEATIYDSRPLAHHLFTELRHEAQRFQQQHGRAARLAQVIVGQADAAEVYRQQLEHACYHIGMNSLTLALPFATTEAELRQYLITLMRDPTINGVLLLLPLPEHIRQQAITDVFPVEKDVDGLGPRNAGNLLLGFPNFVPSTADALLQVIRDARIPVQGKHAVIIGRSNIGGKPIALALLGQDATVTICHSRTEDLARITRSADIVVVSVGRPHFLTAEMLKPGAIVFDAGINPVEGRIVGDVDAEHVREVASFLTPVPGGLGPIIHLTLLRHTLLGPGIPE
ncbi:methylenetetrahydrofolate dehydrogenase (NADP+)/methenyltetrahydrofolate cyclohydrolase [Thermosporothrix hazakensis]|jgi:methylenetetrahydrofolate dehydrogenase (NADP+)/methenyltetrahydrofolate cyclohydrolase|uniref:Bifunctional protein FolD n=1 Tax=Thermosporothrix hazakensis TaxID=644383 RepID=A0A326U572_THEHA|nr:bifunctional 5,10-methylenetetrahydrofolate dehydrogenase/5,10-methenyltetrahydrofolate cyclohydrolase [Thermosporothrix hazakensis]PZW26604.1 methylenetetrahydrofolate dehydrogenase (NADP+)/methenyltetrahydrofolate cyclohydrolase [Thermosporothrix hazakensis]GCE47695.1 bifunctional protein FolD [Thermosporothrix hazakensis]